MTHLGKLTIALLAALLLLTAAPALAQWDAVPIAYGATVQGTISDSVYFNLYQFEGLAGDVVTVEMTAINGDLDTFVGLFGADEQLLISNDDIQTGNLNSRIEAYTLPADGAYYIGATRYNTQEGITTGTFTLTLTLVEGPSAGGGSQQQDLPELSVSYQPIGYNETVTGQIGADEMRYYLFSGGAGDVAVALVRPTGSGMLPVVQFFDTDLTQVAENVPQDDGAASYFVLPDPGWYLIGVTSQSGDGSFELETIGLEAQQITYGDQVAGEVTAEAPNVFYVFEASYGDRVNVQMTASDGDLVPYVVLADLNLNDLATTTVGDNPAALTFDVPRSGPYVLLASRDGLAEGGTTGSFTLRLNGTPLDAVSVDAEPLGYGRTVQGTISDARPVAYYSFEGKRDDLVTISMVADDPAALDPYLVLMDADFNELTLSDNTGTSNTARIFQYALPQNGTYFVLASRPNLDLGMGGGDYTLDLQEGEIELTVGAVEATLRWNHTGDVDLFVRDPLGDIVAWDTPEIASGGILEVDTNANCQTLTALPVEHVYWPVGTNLPGEYQFYVWYQLDCENRGPVFFSLTVSVGGQEVLNASEELELGQRYEVSITVNEDGTAASNNDGRVVTPDTGGNNRPISYGESVTGRIDDDQPVVFYVFDGQAGDTITVTADRSSGDLDPYAALLDANDDVLVQDDDNGGDRNARFTYTLPADGQYTIAVTRYQGTDGVTSGEFVLRLTRAN